jgi:hypothetical protein
VGRVGLKGEEIEREKGKGENSPERFPFGPIAGYLFRTATTGKGPCHIIIYLSKCPDEIACIQEGRGIVFPLAGRVETRSGLDLAAGRAIQIAVEAGGIGGKAPGLQAFVSPAKIQETPAGRARGMKETIPECAIEEGSEGEERLVSFEIGGKGNGFSAGGIAKAEGVLPEPVHRPVRQNIKGRNGSGIAVPLGEKKNILERIARVRDHFTHEDPRQGVGVVKDNKGVGEVSGMALRLAGKGKFQDKRMASLIEIRNQGLDCQAFIHVTILPQGLKVRDIATIVSALLNFVK